MGSENGNYVPDGAWRMQMESKGETVDDVVTAATTFECEGRIRAERVKFIAADVARRCKAAHEREVTVLRDALEDAIELYCAICTDHEENSGKCKDKDDVCPPVARWRKALEGNEDGK